MRHGSECMGRPVPTPYKAEEGRTQVLSTNRSVRPAAVRPALNYLRTDTGGCRGIRTSPGF